MKYRSLIILSTLVLAVAFVAFRWSRSTLKDPRTLIPQTADIYIEAESLGALGPVLERISAEAGIPLSLPYIANLLSPDLLSPLKFPGSTGFDASRPVGIAISAAPGFRPLIVGFIPVRDRQVLTEELGLPPRSLGLRAVALQNGFAGYERGYLLFSTDSETIEDLFVMKEKGLDLPARDPAAIVTAYFLPNLLKTARSLLSFVPDDAPTVARIAPLLMQKAMDAMKSVRMELRDEQDRLRVRTRIDLLPDNALLAVLAAPDEPPRLFDLMPAAGFIGGIRVNVDQARNFSYETLKVIATFISDSDRQAIHDRIDLCSAEFAGAILKWHPMSVDASQAVWLQTISPGTETDFQVRAAQGHHSSTALWQSRLQETGDTRISMTWTDLPQEKWHGVLINGVSIRTVLPLDIPDFEFLKLGAHSMTDRTSIYRFGRVAHPANGEPLWLTATGSPPAVARSMIDHLAPATPSESQNGGAVDTASSWFARNHAALSRVMNSIPAHHSAYALIDPFLLIGRDSVASHPFAVSAGAVSDGLELDIFILREHLRGLGLKFLSLSAPEI